MAPYTTLGLLIIIISLLVIFFIFGPTKTTKTHNAPSDHTSFTQENPPKHYSNDQSLDYLTLQSTSFINKAPIGSRYTCDGENISPELHWTLKDTPQISTTTTMVSTTHAQNKGPVKSYLLIVDDPDAQRVMGKTFVHWMVLLPSHITQLPEGISSKNQSHIQDLDAHAFEGLNSNESAHYYGPCPPSGSGTHTYQFTLFALNQEPLHIQKYIKNAPITAEQFIEHAQTHIIAKTMLTGTYNRDTRK